MATFPTCNGLLSSIQKLLKQPTYAGESGKYNAPFSERSLSKDDHLCKDLNGKVETKLELSNPQVKVRQETHLGIPGVGKKFVVVQTARTIMNHEERYLLDAVERFVVINSLERHSFKFKVTLRRIALIKEKDEEKQLNLRDLENAIYSAQEAIKEYKHLIHKENSKGNSIGDLPILEVAMRKVQEEEEKAHFEITTEDKVILQSNMAQLCAVLGLKLDFLDALSEMPPECLTHRTPTEWIKIFLTDNSESTVMTNRRKISKELLESIGFDPSSTAIETIMARSAFAGSTQMHIDACEWAQLFVEDEFKYNPLLSSPISPFPFYHCLTNAWFELKNIPDEISLESNIDVFQVQIMNLTTEESDAYSKAHTALIAIPQENQNTVLYHGTDHESAQQILFRGIKLYAGRQQRDFSCGKGFYLTTCLEDALNWAKSTTARPAVLSFVVTSSPEDVLHKARKLSLNGNEQWRNWVSLFRNDNVTSEMLEDLDSKYDLLEGPMAIVTTNEISGELVFEPKPSSYQMCLISDSFAEEFEKTLQSIVFFDIS